MSIAVQNHSVLVRVPATSANLGPGFDSLGLALALYDDVDARVTGAGAEVTVHGEGSSSAGQGENNLTVRAIRATLDQLGVRQPGLSLRCRGRIPHSRGLGSSAAAIVAGVSIGDALAGGGLGESGAFSLAVSLEGHPDNVAACLSGGATVAWHADGEYRRVQLEPDSSLVPVAVVPEETLSTQRARGLLPEFVSHRDASANAGRAALLVAALTTHPELLFDATEDRLHQGYRTPAAPRAAELLAKLRAARVPAVISGAGPTILALTSEAAADPIGGVAGAGWRVHRLGVDRGGVRVQWTATEE